LGLLATEEFLSAITGHVLARLPQNRAPRTATIDYAHTGYGPARVQFDGEQTVTTKRFPSLAHYRPRAGDRVLLVPAGRRGWMIVGTTDLVEPDEQLIIKEADQSVTNSTTLVDDTELWVDVEAHATYRIILALHATGSESGDIKLAWSIPTNAEAGGRWVFGAGVSTTPTSGSATVQNAAANWVTERTYGTHATIGNSILENGLLRTGDTPGRLQLRWAQVTSNATATSVRAPSNLWIKRFR
jgi:hypothetical protein